MSDSLGLTTDIFACVLLSSRQHVMEDLHGNIHEHLQRDILAADFLTSVFWSAMSSFRHDTILRPFPPMFLTGEVHKDIEGVVSHIIHY